MRTCLTGLILAVLAAFPLDATEIGGLFALQPENTKMSFLRERDGAWTLTYRSPCLAQNTDALMRRRNAGFRTNPKGDLDSAVFTLTSAE